MTTPLTNAEGWALVAVLIARIYALQFNRVLTLLKDATTQVG